MGACRFTPEALAELAIRAVFVLAVDPTIAGL
jgi:hypothetical protein